MSAPHSSDRSLDISLFKDLQQKLPSIQYLALHQIPDLKCRWVYDFKAQPFLNSYRKKAFKPLLMSQDASLESQFTSYSETFEYLIRAENRLISCFSAREQTNVRLLEIALRTQLPAILDLRLPGRKIERKV